MRLAHTLVLALLLSLRTGVARPDDPGRSESSPVDRSLDELGERFAREIFPLLTRGEEKTSCVGCHSDNEKTQLRYYPDATSNFRLLLAEGYLDANEPDSLLSRVKSTRRRRRMPPGDLPAWSETDIDTLAAFCEELAVALTRRKNSGARSADERFPEELLAPYTGPLPEGVDNSFLTFRQLRGKFSTLFPGDDGHRGEIDLFAARIALLGGADFVSSFSEPARATPSFLSALDSLATAFAERAYRERSGPFAGHPSEELRSLDESTLDAHRVEIARLHEFILHRPPSDVEIDRALELLRRVQASGDRVLTRDRTLRLRLRVADRARGLESVREISIPIESAPNGLCQLLVDQTRGDGDPIAGTRLPASFHFTPGGASQFVRIRNRDTHGAVNFAGLRLRAVPDVTSGSDGEPPQASDDPVALEWTADDSRIELTGAWKSVSVGGRATWDDEDLDAGDSRILVPIDVPVAGSYEIELLHRRSSESAREVLVEVSSNDPHRLAHVRPAPVPPPGEARFHVDQSDDTRAFVDLGVEFRFDEGGHVEYSNRDTRQRVTADAVRFVETREDGSEGQSFVVDNHEADGREDWKRFEAGSFRAYNQVGPDTYHDENRRKGELSLRYRPSLREEWKPDRLYRVQVGYPAKRDHETRAPISVFASVSSPHVQLVHPSTTRAGARLELDASASYTVQRETLSFEWTPLDGASFEIRSENESGSVVSLVTPGVDLAEIAWVALVRALVASPDFLFTRPPSLALATNERVRDRLRLVKLTLDLLGRSPRESEWRRLEGGATLASLREEFLASEEWKSFYFHRIRLYLESQGTPSQDEPVRLWCHVAFNDLPIQEILTAEYTVDESFEVRPRPPEHGRSGLLTTAGFIEGKPGLPSYNYAAQVAEKFLGFVFEITPEIEAERNAETALSTTAPDSSCYSCHKILTPLALQRTRWSDDGSYRELDERGEVIDDSDQGLVKSYPFAGRGMEAFAVAASRKERFLRTMIDTHFIFLFGREMRVREDERTLYREVWNRLEAEGFTVRTILRALLESPEYLEGRPRARSESIEAGASKSGTRRAKVEEP